MHTYYYKLGEALDSPPLRLYTQVSFIRLLKDYNGVKGNDKKGEV